MANNQNLKPWKPGESGNPNGKPKGTKHLSTVIQEMMADTELIYKFADGTKTVSAPAEIIIGVLISKAINGDLKSFDLLAKYGYGGKIDVTSNDKALPIPIIGSLDLSGYIKQD